MPRNVPRICNRIGLALFAMMLVWLSSGLLLQWLTPQLKVEWMASEWASWVMNSVPLYLFGAPTFFLILKTIPASPQIQRSALPFGPLHYALAMVFCLGASWACSIFSAGILALLKELVPGPGLMEEGALETLLGSGMWPNLVFGVLVPAVGEELLFRYALYEKMRGCADKTYILMSGLCFSMFHGNFAQMLFTFVAGCLFAWVYVNTGNLWLPITMHFLVNAVGIFLLPLLLENEATTAMAGIGILLFILGAIAVALCFNRYVRTTLRPPTEPGWPWKPPARPQQHSGYVGWYRQYTLAAQGRAPQPFTSPFPQGLSSLPHTGWVSPRLPSAAKLCLGNPGMILFLSLGALLTLVSILVML